MFVEVFHQLGGREAATRLARARRGRTLDPEVVDAFTRLSDTEEFWRGLEDPGIWTTVRELEPEGPQRFLPLEYLDDAARAFADFADLKSIYSRGHSRRVATLAERMADVVHLPEPEIANVRRAALVHDIGLVAVPSFVLHKPRERLTPAEWEALRLHPYHAERILARVGAFEPLMSLVSAHHERPDGKGFYRGLGAEQIPTGALIVGVADAFDELTHARPEGAARSRRTRLVRYAPRLVGSSVRLKWRHWRPVSNCRRRYRLHRRRSRSGQQDSPTVKSTCCARSPPAPAARSWPSD